MAKGTRARTDATTGCAIASRSRCSNAALRRATRNIGQLYDEVLAPGGLRTTQHSLLVTVRAMGSPTMGQLAEAMVMDLSGLGHTLKPLARDGYLRLVPDAADRRVRRVALTDLGAAKLEQTIPLWQDAQARFEAAFGQARTEALRDILSALATPGFREAFAGGKARDDAG
ncbi:MarR family winged helix-turn-helix transcriptional regulator [Methylobacterium sp. E-041]|uniref:MarR family winged helix-turn-helix transcriptional regulator n=1 Tax=unclassified Methylobacterium TaxID=2615210 RepID=UPI001FB8979D|nr:MULTISPECIES: MarR family winged helix-turn-helix transcriptional regulator [unclassified Methylobacterium]MCJ2006171.1 MarR family winged helix-turn-helix transcriptional regulator [Methylobacterium sp. J-092]MCJ2105637.1 MarR family winged helix-turn-helix transcriptional regulator [Methylobacterium sp. E-041]